ncbi:MAG: NAD(P)-dependent oxidoreductase, partial [Alphaproteobacteria bacterium]|nr:NAD(P)-dependent oxidoreductase [Alphaproteobacteria bacterium]
MTTAKPRVGFIGLGLMGAGFTIRLIECGYSVHGFDLHPDFVARAADKGVKPGMSCRDVATNSDIVMTCVTSTAHLRDVVFGADGVAAGASKGMILVDHSTAIVDDTKEMAEKLRADTGMGWVDAPVSGGPSAAESGELAIMAGGAQDDIDRVAPLMADLSSTFTHFGPVGAGQVAKMVNQVLVLNNYCVLAEALALAEAGGIDAAKIPDALAAGHAGSNMLQSMFPRMIERDYKPAGYARQILKDLDMLHDLAKKLGSPTP